METLSLKLNIEYSQVLDLVRQLPPNELDKLKNELSQMLSPKEIKNSQERLKAILIDVKHYFNNKLGKYTHKKHSKEWYFYALGFSRNDLGYAFGFNIGFFYNSKSNVYEKLGMSVTVRTNGGNKEERMKFLYFFRKKLNRWQSTPESEYYTVERDGKGIEIGKYSNLNNFKTDSEITDFLHECIDGIYNIYNEIIEAKDLFGTIVRAAPPWKETIVELCKRKIEENS